MDLCATEGRSKADKRSIRPSCDRVITEVAISCLRAINASERGAPRLLAHERGQNTQVLIDTSITNWHDAFSGITRMGEAK